MNTSNLNNNGEYVIYMLDIVKDIGFLNPNKKSKIIVLIDGANLLYRLNDYNEQNKISLTLSQAIENIYNYIHSIHNSDKSLPTCEILIDIVLRNFYSFPISTLELNKRHPYMIVSYVRRPIPNDKNEGDIPWDIIDDQRKKVSEYDDAVLFRKIYAYSQIVSLDNIYLFSCDGYNNYTKFLRLVNPSSIKGHLKQNFFDKFPDFEVIEETFTSTINDKFMHFFSYNINFNMVKVYYRIWNNVNKISNNALEKYLFTRSVKLVPNLNVSKLLLQTCTRHASSLESFNCK